jgi:hypothetical protein
MDGPLLRLLSSATVRRVSQPRHRISRLRYPALSASPRVGEGCAGPLKASIRLFQASQARRSGFLARPRRTLRCCPNGRGHRGCRGIWCHQIAIRRQHAGLGACGISIPKEIARRPLFYRRETCSGDVADIGHRRIQLNCGANLPCSRLASTLLISRTYADSLVPCVRYHWQIATRNQRHAATCGRTRGHFVPEKIPITGNNRGKAGGDQFRWTASATTQSTKTKTLEPGSEKGAFAAISRDFF